MKQRNSSSAKFLLLMICIFFASSCAPTIKAVPDSVIRDEETKIIFEQGREQGYKEGVTVTRAEYDNKMMDFMNKYKGELLYIEAVKAGVLKPGQVHMMYMPGAVSSDGSLFSAPSFRWKVVSPPQFQADEAMMWWKKDEANFCYFFLKDYAAQKEALSAVASTEKPATVLLMAMPYADNSGRWAMIGKTITEACPEVISMYQAKGFRPIQVK